MLLSVMELNLRELLGSFFLQLTGQTLYSTINQYNMRINVLKNQYKSNLALLIALYNTLYYIYDVLNKDTYETVRNYYSIGEWH